MYPLSSAAPYSAMDDLLLLSPAIAAFIFFYLLWIKPRSISHKTKPTSLHPEAPEPSGALPIVGHVLLLRPKVQLGRSLGAIADKYGPIYKLRLGVSQNLVVSSLEGFKDCFTNDKVLSTRPQTAAGRLLGYNYGFVTVAPEGPFLREMKKIMTLELLSKTRIDMLKHIRKTEFDTSIKELYSYWAKNKGGGPVVVEINRWFFRLNFNINTMMVVGKRYGNFFEDTKDDHNEAGRFEKAIEEHTRWTGTLVLSDMFPQLEWMDLQGHLKSMKSLSKELDTLLGNWVEEHLQKEKHIGDEKDFIDVMLSMLPKDKLIHGYDRVTAVKATIMSLIVGGTQTTVLSLTWALSLLLNHPDVLRRAQDELDGYVGRDRHVEESDIKGLVYLQAIVKETLRLYPVVPIAAHQAMEDCQVGGYHVSKGTRVLMNIWKLHRDPNKWSDPDDFRPERFLTIDADIYFNLQEHAYLPFSAGRRMCLGINLATQVFHFALARLLHGFDVKNPLHTPVDMSEGIGITLPQVNPVQVLLIPRLPSKLYED